MLVKNKSIKEIVKENVLLLIPLMLYGFYKNGFLIYERGLVNGFISLKPLWLILISVVIKWVGDIFKTKKLKLEWDYNLLCLVLLSMIMPYNINISVYIITLFISYIASLLLDKVLKYNKICLIYLIIMGVNCFFNDFSYLNLLEQKLAFSFSGIDLLMGRCVGGISSTSIIISLGIFIYLTYNFYYKKDIPITINLTYLFLVLAYFLITKDSKLFINGDLVFASIFVSTIPYCSPYKVINQIFYGIAVGLISFLISVFFNPTISIYIGTFLLSLLGNFKFDKISQKLPLPKRKK